MKQCRYSKWALTLTIRPELLNQLSAVEQYEYMVPYLIESVIPKLGETLISIEETKAGNLHFHLAIRTKWEMPVKEMRSIIDKAIENSGLGYYWLTPIHDEYGWYNYMNKRQFWIEKYKYSF